MIFQNEQERSLAAAIAGLVYSNPFLTERMAFEQAALGEEFVPGDAVWNALSDASPLTPNVLRIGERADALACTLRDRLAAPGGVAGVAEADVELYEALVFYVLYHRSREPLGAVIEAATLRGERVPPQKIPYFGPFARDVEHFLVIPGLRLPAPAEAPHLFACFFQILRAFHFTFRNIVGRSIASARLRAGVWQSVFTHDMRRYFRVLHSRMGDITTLITGPSGTGKELVARAVGMSRYIPFDPKTRTFTEDFAASFHPLNLSALSPTLIESELFGHRRGAFTGALEDRAGWLEVCPPLGTVFLDEIGELDPLIQVKLLRVLQTRTFQRLGDTATRHFRGKIIAATNRHLPREMARGAFRQDFYYRLCADMIATPSLREQLDGAEARGELHDLLLFITRRVIDDDLEEAESLAVEVETWIDKHLGRGYPWPGNFRELEQCVRNVLIRQEYHPPASLDPDSPAEQLAEAFTAGSLTADQLLRKYCTLVYSRTRNYEETARRLGLDRRTVKSKVDGDPAADQATP